MNKFNWDNIDDLNCIKCNTTKNLSRFSLLKNRIYCTICLDCKGRIISLLFKARKLKNNGIKQIPKNPFSLDTLTEHFIIDLTNEQKQKMWDFFINYSGNKVTRDMLKNIIGIENENKKII